MNCHFFRPRPGHRSRGTQTPVDASTQTDMSTTTMQYLPLVGAHFTDMITDAVENALATTSGLDGQPRETDTPQETLVARVELQTAE